MGKCFLSTPLLTRNIYFLIVFTKNISHEHFQSSSTLKHLLSLSVHLTSSRMRAKIHDTLMGIDKIYSLKSFSNKNISNAEHFKNFLENKTQILFKQSFIKYCSEKLSSNEETWYFMPSIYFHSIFVSTASHCCSLMIEIKQSKKKL